MIITSQSSVRGRLAKPRGEREGVGSLWKRDEELGGEKGV